MSETKGKIISRRTAYDGWNRLEEVTVASGTGEHRREIITHGDAASLLPYDPERRMALLVRQLRAPLLARSEGDGWVLEACAGIIDPGETPREAALREGEEELGVRLGGAEHLASVYPAPGCLDELAHLYLAVYEPADRIGEGGGNDHEGEEIEVIEMPLDDLYRLMRERKIIDAKTLIMAQALLARGA
ncbi:NUDIX hydrolase [Afifella sp. IM 167]|uniref:NUDIX domain-containing protein n=1 Tax=Afifella sp. IM 167 TaxID=2033586 RepID=UPI001CCC6FCD|nr:NUDIX hydrolase [Afifella sp. IM 167]